MGYANTAREVRKILRDEEILIDNRVIKNPKFPVGVMDIINIKSKNEYFILFINSNNKYQLKKINNEESKLKLCKIINKKTLKKRITQLNLYDGRNVLVEKDNYKPGDTIILDLKNNKINSHLKLEKNAFVYIIGGKYIGSIGRVENITERKGLQVAKILIKIGEKRGLAIMIISA